MSRKAAVKPAHEGHQCQECGHGTPDMKFENLSITGKPTLIICPHTKFKHNLKEPACRLFIPKNGQTCCPDKDR